MPWILIQAIISATILVSVAVFSKQFPRFGALLLTLPVVSILAFGVAWIRDHDLAAISRLARETLVLVPLGLPFFVPLAFADKLGIGFWSAMLLGATLASMTISGWFAFGPKI